MVQWVQGFNLFDRVTWFQGLICLTGSIGPEVQLVKGLKASIGSRAQGLK